MIHFVRRGLLIPCICVVLSPFTSGQTEETVSKVTPAVSIASLKKFEARMIATSKIAVASTVGIRIGNAQGSGVIVSKDGYVLTAAHVFERPGQKAEVILRDGTVVDAKTLGRQQQDDFGLLKITEKRDFPFAEMGTTKILKLNDPCLATGHPGGFQSRRTAPVRMGQITRLSGMFIRTDCIINHGDSGGPLFDLDGRVLGIHSRIQTNVRDNYHVSVDKYRDHWKDLVAGKSWSGRKPRFGPGPVFGIRGRDDREQDGCRVLEAYLRGPSDAAGLRKGDLIVGIDTEPVSGIDDLIELIRRREPGDEIDVHVLRTEEKMRFTVKLGKKD